MVVLAASICTKGGKAVISRQFRDMTRARIESLLASFPKLIPTGTQHTMVETSEVRFVYQPLEDLYIVLITNKSSNILQDIDTLHLFARVVSDLCRSAEEREILKNSFEVLGAFDEVVSLGYRENVNLAQVRSVLEMESHEEKIQEIIARNKEAEAKEELKRRAKQLEMQRRDQQRRAGGGGGGYGMGGGISGYAAVPQRFDTPEPAPIRSTSPAPSSIRAPAFKGSGMKLGSKKVKQDQLLDALGGEVRSATSSPAPGSISSAKAEPASRKGLRGSLPAVDAQGIHLAIKEEVSATLGREGGLKSMELVGDMTLHVSDASSTKVHIHLQEASTDFGSDLAIKQHPHINKQALDEERVVKLKDLSRSFPVNQALAVLKWRYKGKDESLLPMSINCWPTPSGDGTCEVNIDYELDNSEVTLHDVVFSIPLPAGETPSVSSHSGEWSVDYASNTLKWSVGTVSSAETTGALEFSVASADAEAFYPVSASFVAATSLAGILVNSITHSETGAEVSFSQDPVLSTSEYQVA